MEAHPTSPPVQLGPGTEIKNLWRLTSLIGAGSFGQIYIAETINSEQKTEVAVKFERLDAPRAVLHVETYALVQMQGVLSHYSLSIHHLSVFIVSGKPHFAKSYYFGYLPPYTYLVQEALGPSLLYANSSSPCVIKYPEISSCEYRRTSSRFRLLYK